MNETKNPTFQSVFRQSFKSTNRQIPALLETLFFLFVRWLPYILVSIIIFYVAALWQSRYSTAIEIIGFIYSVVAAAKLNASLGLAIFIHCSQ